MVFHLHHSAPAVRQFLAHIGRLPSLSREEAEGQCFASSLELGLIAEEWGLTPSLVHWSIRNDRQYCEHWAVLMDDNVVIDLTRAQVDARPGNLFLLADYPASFGHPRIYPAAGILHLYQTYRHSRSDRLPPQFFWRVRRLLLRLNLSQAVRHRKPAQWIGSCASYLQFCLRYPAHLALHKLMQRKTIRLGGIERGVPER